MIKVDIPIRITSGSPNPEASLQISLKVCITIIREKGRLAADKTMRLLTHNMLRCNAKGCIRQGKGLELGCHLRKACCCS